MGDEETVEAVEAEDESVDVSDDATEDTDTTEGEDNSEQESDKADSSLEKEEGTDEDDVEDDDAEPPVRKPRTPSEWVEFRKQRKAERDARKADDAQGDDNEEEEDDDISPEDQKIIQKAIDKRLKPYEEAQRFKEIESEIDTYVKENPDFEPFAKKAAKWAKNPSWENVPTEQLMYAVAGKKLLAIGAKRRTEAEKKANKTKIGGSSPSNAGGGTKPVSEMTDEEMQQEIDRVKYGGK